MALWNRRAIASLLTKTSSGRSYRYASSISKQQCYHYGSSRNAHFTASSQQCDHPRLLKHDHTISDHQEAELDFPGGKVRFTSEMQFLLQSPEKRIPCFRLLDDAGHPISLHTFPQLSRDLAVKMYKDMVTIQVMDTTFFVAQRQRRISFYLTSDGEEAISVASAAALKPHDIVLPQVLFCFCHFSINKYNCYAFACGLSFHLMQYREPGILLWRGFTIQDFANQCFGNKADYGKGRQMPVHYGSKKLNCLTISSPLGTQLPQAVGVAYSLKMEKKEACAVTYFGDGTSSEGDFHAALNFAAVTEAPVIFICRNNGWAISTPSNEQFRSDGIVVKGQGYGIRSIRVDGNDAVAIYEAVREARFMAVKEQMPILIEVLSYRAGHHSTSDDSSKYRPTDEIEYWKMARNPVKRYRNWITGNGWWSDDQEAELQSNIKIEILQAIQVAEKMQKPPVAELFTDVYDIAPTNLLEQERSVREALLKYPQEYQTNEIPAS